MSIILLELLLTYFLLNCLLAGNWEESEKILVLSVEFAPIQYAKGDGHEKN